MIAPALPYMWSQKAKAFFPLGRVQNLASASYGDGEVVMLAPVEERSDVSHKHEFAWLKEAWLNLPQALAEQYPNPAMLRKRGLIATGHCTVQDYVCTSHAEAARWATYLRREVDEYALVVVSAGVVRVFKAKSQARGAMKREEFQQSKQDLMDWVAGLLGVDADSLSRARAA